MLRDHFTSDSERVGYHEIEERLGVLYTNATMLIDGSELEHPFRARHYR
jgi:hypothetical protein